MSDQPKAESRSAFGDKGFTTPAAYNWRIT
jgi:hypothetical protein